MEKLDKVIRALECHYENEDLLCEGNCPYEDGSEQNCLQRLMRDCLEVARDYRRCLTGCGIRQYGRKE